MCKAGLPHRISKGEANVVLIVNIFFPGVGTIVAGCLGTHGGTAICIGLLQLLLFPVLIGWIWALIWSLALRRQASHGKHGTREADVERGASSQPTGKDHHESSDSHRRHDHHQDHVQHGTPSQEHIPPPPNAHDSYPPQVPPPPPSAPPLY